MTWQPGATVPCEPDKIILLKTRTGVVSGQWFPGEYTSAGDEYGAEYNPPVFSCYDDAITIECDYNEDGKEFFPEILGWMELPI